MCLSCPQGSVTPGGAVKNARSLLNMTTEDKLKALGFPLPPAPAAVAAYVPWVRTGNLIFTSGQLPWRDGQIAFKGKLGAELTEQQGYDAARLCVLNALAQLKEAVGDLDRVQRILKLEGYVHSAPGFRGQPKVLNGASELINSAFGDRGKHARLALGISEMPLDAAVQLSLTAEVS
ncbi:MAG: RidA family protein [Verrucomicrobiota bacterium]|jgi:enamine deaminase RidA (YjgF/YER057c/UK114 family)